jgi:hypothetical protein
MFNKFKIFFNRKSLISIRLKQFSKEIEPRGHRERVLDETTLKKYNSLFKLNDRAVLSVSGEDATSFLQSLITNDMNIFKKNPNQVAIFSLFLNPKGRILFDGIIVKSDL